MTEPPAAVVRSYKPVGNLQLHRFGRQTGYRCSRCGRDKTEFHAATLDRDWSKAVCHGCYSILLRAQQGKAKASGGTAQTGKSRVSTTDVARGRREKLEYQVPGVSRLIDFFRAARIDVQIGRHGSLRIDGRQTPPLAKILPAGKSTDWDSVIDAMAMKYAGRRFISAVEDNARFSEGLRAFPRRLYAHGFAIVRGEVRLAMIRATRVEIRNRPAIHANFLTPGPHWQHVADVLNEAEPELMARWVREQETRAAEVAAAAEAEAERMRAAARRRIDRLPEDLDSQLRQACIVASRRIRLERRVAYDRPVTLECKLGELTLLPVAGPENRLLIPFCLNGRGDTLRGDLVLEGSDPLPLLIGVGVSDDDAITAWTCALLGVADATCIEFDQIKSIARHDTRTQRRHPAFPPSPQSSVLRSLPRKEPPLRRLEPAGEWIQYAGAFVAGHRRHLNEGQTASDEARNRARDVGITLDPHETWVRPHARGLPEDIQIRFLWHAPAELIG